MPAKHSLLKHKSTRFFSEHLLQANVWHLNRQSASKGLCIGLFMAFLPIPGQVVFALLLCLLLRANLPLTVTAVFVTNPLTVGPVFYGTYVLGTTLMDLPTREFAIEFSLTWLKTELLYVWKPLVLGSVLTSFCAAALGYTAVDVFWRLHTIRRWKKRNSQLP